MTGVKNEIIWAFWGDNVFGLVLGYLRGHRRRFGMLRPFLFVGIGGSGGKTLQALKQTLERRLRQMDWTEGLPDAWQFVHIDMCREESNFPAPMLPPENFIQLLQPGETYNDIVQSLEDRVSNREDQKKAFSGWLFPPSAVGLTTFWTGATPSGPELYTSVGLRRSAGRALSAARLSLLRDRFEGVISKMQTPESTNQLAELSRSLRPKSVKEIAVKQPIVIVVASMVGRTGSGMFMDVTEVLKSIDPGAAWLQQQTAFLFTPEVYENSGTTFGTQGAANALGMMNEIMSGLWAV